nr:beta-amyrin 28-monooxygenase-like [Ziziphus jujuba var. spinosa]
MDLIFQSLSLLLFILFATSTYFLFNHKNYSNSKNLPPGSAGWPIIGETIEFLYETPENFINHRTKKYSSQVFMTNIFRRPTAIFSGPAGSKFISSNDQKLLKVWYPPSQRSLFQMNRPNPTPTPTPSPSQPSPATQPQPKTLTSASGFLRPEARYVAKFDSFTKSFLRSYLEAKQEVVEVYPFAKTFTLTLACNYFMGLEDSERAENLVGKFDDLAMGIHSMDLNFPGTIFHRASKAAAELRKELGIFIEEKRVKMSSNNGVVKEDLLSQLIAGNQSGRKFTPPEKIVETMLGLLTASYSSAATVITFMVKHIGERPDIYQKILSGIYSNLRYGQRGKEVMKK